MYTYTHIYVDREKEGERAGIFGAPRQWWRYPQRAYLGCRAPLGASEREQCRCGHLPRETRPGPALWRNPPEDASLLVVAHASATGGPDGCPEHHRPSFGWAHKPRGEVPTWIVRRIVRGPRGRRRGMAGYEDARRWSRGLTVGRDRRRTISPLLKELWRALPNGLGRTISRPSGKRR